MNRNAFNMIELIFVIVILGILSSIVVVKLGQMSEHARLTKLKSFVGTLNRSVSGAVWFKSINDERGGSVAFADYDAELDKYIEPLPFNTQGPSIINCNESGDGIFLTYAYAKNYEVHCRDGNKTSSPIFKIYNETDSLYIE